MREQKQTTESESKLSGEGDTIFRATSLNTDFKHTFGLNNAKHGSENIKGFLTTVKINLLKEAF